MCQVNNVVSGALDRLHYEKDPCVRYDALRKVWIYLHRGRTEEDFGMYVILIATIHVAVILILFMGNAVYWGVGYGIVRQGDSIHFRAWIIDPHLFGLG